MKAQTTSTTPISDAALAAALALLINNFAAGNKNEVVDLESEFLPTTSAAIDKLDDEAAELESVLSGFSLYVRRKIADVHHRRNALTPVGCLPAELLQVIFQFQVSNLYISRLEPSKVDEQNAMSYSDDEDSETELKWDRKGILPDTPYSTVIKIATVCSQWYNIALSIPQLWIYLDTRHSLETVPLILERSKGNPLYIHYAHGISTLHESGFIKLILPHVHRWKSFYSYSRDAALFSRFKVDDYSAPMLEHFILPRSVKSVGFWDQLPSLILERSPRLRNLHVASLGYPLGSRVLTGLTHLSVASTVERREFTMAELEHLFIASPNLETIFLNGSATGEVSLFSVTLPNLKSIHLYRFHAQYANALLLSIFPPPNHHTVAKVTEYWDVEQSTAMISDPTRVDSLLALALRSATWLSAPINNFKEDTCVVQVGKDLHGVRVTLLEIYCSEDAVDDVLASLRYPNSDSFLRSMDLYLHRSLPGRALASNLSHYPYIEQLDISIPTSYNGRSFLDALSNPHPCLCPQLTRLSFKKVGNLRPVLELVKARYGTPQDTEVVASQTLRRLEHLKLQCVKNSLAETEESTREELKSFLAERNIQLEITTS